LPNVGPYIYDVSISGFTRSSIYIYDISSLRVKRVTSSIHMAHRRLVVPIEVNIRKVLRPATSTQVFLVSLCLQANAEMVPKFPSCYYTLLM